MQICGCNNHEFKSNKMRDVNLKFLIAIVEQTDIQTENIEIYIYR